jgi:hypothetical protein
MSDFKSHLSKVFPTRSSKVFAVSVLLVVLSLSAFVGLYHPQVSVSGQPDFLAVSVSGPKELGVNQIGTYTASVTSSNSGNLVFSWSISPQDNNTVIVADGSKCSLTFTEATSGGYMLTCNVKDKTIGNGGCGYVAVFDPYTSPGYNFDASTASFTYMIETDGLGWYQAVRGSDGSVMSGWTSTNASAVINSARAALIAGRTDVETIKLMGDITVSSPILLGNYTALVGPATIRLASGATCNIIQNLDQTLVGNHHVYIENLDIYGQYYQYGQGDSISIKNPTNLNAIVDFPNYDLINLNIYYSNQKAISMDNVFVCLVQSVSMSWGNSIGFEFNGTDSRIDTVFVRSFGSYGMSLCNFGSNFLSTIYLGGNGLPPQLFIQNEVLDHWSNLFIDSSYEVSIFLSANSHDNQFMNTQITKGSKYASGTYDAVIISSSSYNTFSTLSVSNYSVATLSNIGVFENGTSNYNQYIGVNTLNGCTTGIVTAGSNSQVSNSWNISTWIGSNANSVFSTEVVSENVAVGNVIFHNSTGYWLANALTSATLPVQGVFGIAMQTITAGNLCQILTGGEFTYSGWSLTVGPYYVSNSTSGAIMANPPVGSGQQSEEVAQALSTTTILFNPKSVIGL